MTENPPVTEVVEVELIDSDLKTTENTPATEVVEPPVHAVVEVGVTDSDLGMTENTTAPAVVDTLVPEVVEPDGTDNNLHAEKNNALDNDVTPENSLQLADDNAATPEEKTFLNEIINEVRKKYLEGVEHTFYEIGNILVEKLYGFGVDDDWKISDITENKQKERLFNLLQNQIEERGENEKDLPKYPMLYKSFRLVLDRKQYGELESYQKLSISHRLELLPIKDSDKKIEKINLIATEGHSVRKTRQIVKDDSSEKTPTMMSAIRNPRSIENVELVVLAGGDKKVKAIQKVKDNIGSLETEIQLMQEDLKKLKLLQTRIEAYDPPKGRKPKGA